jgi:hypothetical protein
MDAFILAVPQDQRAALAGPRAVVMTAVTAYWGVAATAGSRSIADDMCLKLISEGVRDPKQCELVRRQHKLNVALRLILPMMNDLESATVKKVPQQFPVPKLAAIDHEENEDDPQQLTQDELALINNRRKQQASGAAAPKGGGGGRGGGGGGHRGGARGGHGGGRGGGAAVNTRLFHDPAALPGSAAAPKDGIRDPAAYYSKLCTYCSKHGHLVDVCYKKKKDEQRSSNGNGGNGGTAHDGVNSITPSAALNGLGWQ